MKYAFILLLSAIAKFLIAQQPLLFESRIYFEDSAGNKDTIEIGYDTTANSFLNPVLGETDLKNVFNDEFEVRASHSFDWGSHPSECILSKKIIGACEKVIDINDPLHICFGSEGIIFFIKTKHQPVKISWDRKAFEDKIKSCDGNSFFTPDYNYHVSDPWVCLQWTYKRFACASKEDRFIVNLDRKYIDSNYSKEYTFSTSRLFSKGVKDTILGVELNFEINSDFSPCQLISQTEDPKNNNKRSELQFVYPNPTSDYLMIGNVSDNPVIGIGVFDQFGHRIERINQLDFKNEDNKISVEKLQSGIYFIQLKYADNFIAYKRFLKI